MYDIQDMRIYLHRMQKSVLDKVFEPTHGKLVIERVD